MGLPRYVASPGAVEVWLGLYSAHPSVPALPRGLFSATLSSVPGAAVAYVVVVVLWLDTAVFKLLR